MALTVNGRTITQQELENECKILWKENEFVQSLIRRNIIRELAENEGVTVTDQDLQNKADAYRMNRGLYSAEDTKKWLKANEMTEEDLEKIVMSAVMYDKLCAAWSDDDIGKFFAENRLDMDKAQIYMLVTQEEAVAQELKTQIEEDEADFMQLAREYSIHPTAKAGGYVGEVARSDLASEAAAAVFGAKKGELCGPFDTAEGYTLIWVFDQKPAELNDETKALIRTLMTNQKIQQAEQKADIRWD